MAKPTLKRGKVVKEQPTFQINDEIPNYPMVRIVGEGIESKVVSMSEAERIASEMELDLIAINTSAQPPIIRIANYEKFIYEMKKKEKSKKKVETKLKIIQLKTNIAAHDLETKINQAKDFINHGDKVKVVLTMKGRELSRREVSSKCLLEFIVGMDDVAVAEAPIREEGNRSSVILKKKTTNKQ